MKALTLWQPWAQLVAWGHKSVETRCWTTKYRGPLAIHAAQRLPPDWLGASRHSKEFRFELSEVLHEPETQVQKIVESLPRGCVLAVVKLVDIVPASEICDEISQRERIFGNYEDGRYAWFLELQELWEDGILAKGNRMLWNWDEKLPSGKSAIG